MNLKKFVTCVGLLGMVLSVQAKFEPGFALEMMLMNTLPARSNEHMWDRLRDGFQMPEVSSNLVRQHELMFMRNPGLLNRAIERSRRYMYFILDEVERRGLPTELALLPVIESSFLPEGTSPVGAAGLWQFMPATGQEYGLEQTFWYDGRRDVVKSTRAALDYLVDLNHRLDDWPLALASYNWGIGNVQKAVRRSSVSIGAGSYYEVLRMPKEPGTMCQNCWPCGTSLLIRNVLVSECPLFPMNPILSLCILIELWISSWRRNGRG